MALSRIWTAFIIIALLVATGRYFFEEGQQGIFNSLVTGKSNDTTYTSVLDTSALPAGTNLQNLAGQNKVTKNAEGQYVAYKLLPANGIFETTKDAVTLSLGLIGIMALFLGFMAIAEKAGGIRFLSRIIGPFFSKYFLKCPKTIPPWGIW